MLGTTARSVEYARRTYGRFSKSTERLCVVCDERPVFIESPKARRLGLCKGCYLDELARRASEERESARLRQAARRARGKAD